MNGILIWKYQTTSNCLINITKALLKSNTNIYLREKHHFINYSFINFQHTLIVTLFHAIVLPDVVNVTLKVTPPPPPPDVSPPASTLDIFTTYGQGHVRKEADR